GPAAASAKVQSPNGLVEFRLALERDQLTWAVTFRGTPVTGGPLGISVDGALLGQGVRLGAVETYRVRQRYPWRGVHAEAVNHANGARIALDHAASKTAYTLEVRAFDDGVAFRHVVPGRGMRVPAHATTFTPP